MDSTPAVGLSLWLMPEGEVRRELAGWIARLAERFRTERFEPHLTLLGSIPVDEAQAREATARVASQLSPFTVRLDGIDGRDEHFRCVFVRAELDPPLRSAHETAARGFGLPAQPDFLPHLSLVYGRLLEEQKHALAHEAGADVSMRFEASTLHLWSTAGPLAEWRALGVFPFPRS
jgi:2'-5' RNA ligase